MEASMEVDANRFTSMEISSWWKYIFFHGSWWKPRRKYMEVSTVVGSGSFHCCHQLQARRVFSEEAAMNFHVPLHTFTCIHEYRKLRDPSTRLSKGSIDFRSNYHGTFMGVSTNFHGSQFASMEEVNLLLWKKLVYLHGSYHGNRWIFVYFHGNFKLVELDLLSWKLVEASMEVHGSVHCRWKCKLPLLPSIAASAHMFRGGFHELPCPPTYFHLRPRVSQTSSCCYETLTLTLTLSWSYLHGSWPTSHFHGSWWKLPWKYM